MHRSPLHSVVIGLGGSNCRGERCGNIRLLDIKIKLSKGTLRHVHCISQVTLMDLDMKRGSRG